MRLAMARGAHLIFYSVEGAAGGLWSRMGVGIVRRDAGNNGRDDRAPRNQLNRSDAFGRIAFGQLRQFRLQLLLPAEGQRLIDLAQQFGRIQGLHEAGADALGLEVQGHEGGAAWA